MKIIFLSNYFNHHQKPFCDAMYHRFDENFQFVSCSDLPEYRKELGYAEMTEKYVRTFQESMHEEIDNCDVVIIGSAPYDLIKTRVKKGKITFVYSERLYKEKIPWLKIPKHAIIRYRLLGRHKNVFVLCASAFTSYDYSLNFCVNNRFYKWGYFPETIVYNNIDDLLEKKWDSSHSTIKILWVGRTINWKHPESMLFLAQKLRSEGIGFKIDLIGTGEMDEWLDSQIKKEGLGDNLTLLGSMTPTEVRKHMEGADIFVFTSDRNEGWGAVLNESMNSGCAVVASSDIGAVPFLISNGNNGLVFQSNHWDDMYKKVRSLIESPSLRKTISKNAYLTIKNLWNANVAADNFVCLIESIKQRKDSPFKEGPCSKAALLNNSWLKRK